MGREENLFGLGGSDGGVGGIKVLHVVRAIHIVIHLTLS